MKVCIDGIIQEMAAPDEPIEVEAATPTVEERLEAIEAALLEQLLRGLDSDV